MENNWSITRSKPCDLKDIIQLKPEPETQASDSLLFIKNYDEKITENGIICRDMIRLAMEL